MGMLPFFAMPRKHVQDILAGMPPQDRERVEKGLEHSRTLYDLCGNHIPHDFEKEKLLDVISQRVTYVVDTNSDWKNECKKQENLDKAFIITPALSRETTNTLDLILDKSRSKLGNIFSFGIDDRFNCVIVERIDEAFQYEFDVTKLKQASKGKGPFIAKQKAEHVRHIEHEKELIRFQVGLELLFTASLGRPPDPSGRSPVNLGFWDSGKARDLPPPDQMQYAIDRLKTNIRRRYPECKYNVNKSKTVVEMCHRTLLLEDKQIRSEFDDPKKENVFGDMYILLGAIYLGANIMTKDVRLTKMASYAGIKCDHVPPA